MIKYDDESGIATVTITHYAQKSLGDVVFVELPETGATIQQGGQWFPPIKNKITDPPFQKNSLMTDLTDSVGAVESVKAASDIVRTDIVKGLN